MELISTLFVDIFGDGSSERIIKILAIGFVTMTCILVLALIKVRKLKVRIKQLEHKQN